MPDIADDTARHPVAPPSGRWSWVERSVWTDRMLNALEQGVRGGKWHSLIDKVYRAANLHAAYCGVAANGGSAGVDHISVERYATQLEHNQSTLATELRTGTYEPRPVRRCEIPKPGSRETRPLGIPCVRDRIAQRALKHVIEPIFEHTFSDSSYGFRPGRGCKDALRAVDELLSSGYCHVVDADIRAYFDNISHSLLLDEVRRQIGDGKILDLLTSFLQQGIFDGLNTWVPEDGTPQGAVVSPLLANIFLNPFDWFIQAAGIQVVRYADDFVLLCRSAEEAQHALELTTQWMQEHQLALHPDKTRLVDMTVHRASFTFLGYEFIRNVNKWGKSRIITVPGHKARTRFAANVRHQTPRNHGHSLAHIVERLNATLRGWYGYYKHSTCYEFPALDSFIRRRLRRILRKRIKRHRGTGRSLRDHQRWPNAFFAAMGLFSLEAAHLADLQSLRRTH